MVDVELEQHVPGGGLVALADGFGAPRSVGPRLSRLASQVPGLRLLLGWCPSLPIGLELDQFADVRTVMGGYGLRASLRKGSLHYVPARLSAMPALLAGPLRPDLVVISARPGHRGLHLGSEVGWIRAATEVADHVACVLNPQLPCSDADGPLPRGDVVVIGEENEPPAETETRVVDEDLAEIGERIAALLPAGARVQLGPGPLGRAVTDALRVPVSIDSGLLTDDVMRLAGRRLLVGTPSGTYLAGSRDLYEWADGRAVLHRVEVTHDPSRLAADHLFALNTALEIDRVGAVNVEYVDGAVVGGVGGHADFAGAAARSRHGASIVALPSRHRGHPTLVDSLSGPVTTPRCDVDVVVTERGHADLRGLSDLERTRLLVQIWGLD